MQRGHHVSHLGRTQHESGVKSFTWNVAQHQMEGQTLQGIDTIIHLAGAGIADKPWTEKRKREILESRTNSTRLLYDELKRGGHSVKTFICASAIGYYGFEDQEEIFTEESPPGKDFLAVVTQRWEKEADSMEELGIRVVKIRTGIVLTEKGGVLKELMRPIELYIGAPLGSGNQYISWIHIDDHCGIFIKAMDDQKMTGPYNSVTVNPTTNGALTKAIAETLHKPLILPRIPSFVLRLLLGEMADLVLRGNRISATKILQAGYEFKFVNIQDTLHDLLQKKV